MKLIKLPKCADCNTFLGSRGGHCVSMLMNGCDAYYCAGCWQEHSRIHDMEWLEMSESEQDAIIQNREDNG